MRERQRGAQKTARCGSLDAELLLQLPRQVSLDDEPQRFLGGPSFEALTQDAPRRAWRPLRVLCTGTTTMRVVPGVLRVATNTRAPAQPTIHAGLALEAHEAFQIGKLSDASPAVQRELADLRGAELDGGVILVPRDNGSIGARCANELSARTGTKLDVVNDGAHRYRPQGQAVAWHDVGVLAGNDLIPRAERQWRQNVAQHAVLILYQCHVARALRRVLNPKNARRDVLPATFEVDEADTLPRAASTMSSGDLPPVVPARVLDPVAGELRDDSPFKSLQRLRLKQLL
mmetsp:Transcript_43002/g.93636  ORF Transcript_43002/g.93636 Transcript_43002/m.93636 type:complete len:288 (-) Transcript_43002:220-1083(-)